ncbi:DUF937 domain-containing protein [Rhizobium sp. TRM95796]|uniref:DUF937 domain-containing protein n=1 Tax=Rhizobium sp. TRM95796 TaxID=2979862 RepID=UPI0021E9A2B1|nr:DUF937 domain-containing protein [Rhizobium sp. TRM95796]MCV3766848.1 DUF937 domain-containing protein [Rhizobium sp. TRM95796]
MLPLFDLMMNAQNGQATEAMARQFGLAQEQMQKAMTALMPAFSSGFKRSAANPYDFNALLQSAMSGGYAKYFEDMGKAFTPQGVADGNAILGQLFGSKDVSRAIAAQAAQMSGIGQEVLKQMLPVMANAMVGGFLRQVADQFRAAGDAITAGDGAKLMEPWLRASGMAQQPETPTSSFPNPFLDAMQAMMAPAAAKQEKPADPFAANPFLQMLGAMNAAMSPQQTKPATPDPVETAPSSNLFSQMFESGIEVQKAYQSNLDSILNSYFSGAKSRAE